MAATSGFNAEFLIQTFAGAETWLTVLQKMKPLVFQL